MDCKEFQDHVTEAVDRQLPQDEMKAFLGHAGVCAACRNEFEAEKLTARLVHARLAMVPTPATVREAIAGSLSAADAEPPGGLRSGWRRLTASFYFRPALAFAIGAAAILLLVRDTPDALPVQTAAFSVPGDILKQSMSNYHAVVNRTLLPECSGEEPERVLDFFRGKTEFPVIVPRMKECVLVGGATSSFAGVGLAHVVYRHDAEVVYLYQACWEEVQRGERIQLPVDVRSQLKATGWYSASQPDGYSIVLWTKGRTLCSAVAHMPKDQLLACLTDGEGPAVKPW